MALVNLVKSIYTATDVTSLGELTSTDQAGLPDGTAASPGLVFSSDSDSGLYRIGANNIGLAVGGTKVIDIAAATVVFALGNNSISLSNAFGSTSQLISTTTTDTTNNFYTDLAGISTASGNIKTFRVTNTTGSLTWAICRGDNTNSVNHQLGANAAAGSSYLCALHGNLLIGTSSDAGTGKLQVVGDVAVTGDISVSTKTPASASASGVAGTITWDASYIYVCTATNTWKRAAIATW